jgi:hypothetical protein
VDVLSVEPICFRVQKLVIRLIEEPVRLWTSESGRSLVASSRSLLEFAMLEASGVSSNASGESEAHRIARSLVHSLGTLSTVGRRCKLAGSPDSSSIFREFWNVLLPNVYQLLACVHNCMSPETKVELSAVPDKLWVTVVSPEESGYILGEVFEHDPLLPAVRSGCFTIFFPDLAVLKRLYGAQCWLGCVRVAVSLPCRCLQSRDVSASSWGIRRVFCDMYAIVSEP